MRVGEVRAKGLWCESVTVGLCSVSEHVALLVRFDNYVFRVSAWHPVAYLHVPL